MPNEPVKYEPERLAIGIREKHARKQRLKEILGNPPKTESEVARKLANYIINECSGPEVPYFAVDAGAAYLNLYDLYREMVNGTALGKEQELIWGKTLKESQKPAR